MAFSIPNVLFESDVPPELILTTGAGCALPCHSEWSAFIGCLALKVDENSIVGLAGVDVAPVSSKENVIFGCRLAGVWKVKAFLWMSD